MLKQKSNAILLLNLLLISSSLFGCLAHAPPKPVLTLGVIDYPANEVIENQTGSHSFRSISSFRLASYRNLIAAIETNGNRVPLASYDSAVALKPKQWEILMNYLDALNVFIVNHCQ